MNFCANIVIIVMITQPRNDSLKQFNISIHPHATALHCQGGSNAYVHAGHVVWKSGHV